MSLTLKLEDDVTKKSWFDILELDLDYDFDELWDLQPEEYGEVRIIGKLIRTPRKTQSYLHDYTFSGTQHLGVDLPVALTPFLETMNRSDYATKNKFNEVLVNWYADGTEYIGAHSDDERNLLKNSPIVTISLGSSRTFRIRDRQTKEIVRDYVLNNRSVGVMGGQFQREFKHEVVKVGGKKGQNIGPRISITLRKFRE